MHSCGHQTMPKIRPRASRVFGIAKQTRKFAVLLTVAQMLTPNGCMQAFASGRGKRPQRRPQKRLGRRLEEVAEAVGGGYCRLQMPLRLALGVRGTVAGHGLVALEVRTIISSVIMIM